MGPDLFYVLPCFWCVNEQSSTVYVEAGGRETHLTCLKPPLTSGSALRYDMGHELPEVLPQQVAPRPDSD